VQQVLTGFHLMRIFSASIPGPGFCSTPLITNNMARAAMQKSYCLCSYLLVRCSPGLGHSAKEPSQPRYPRGLDNLPGSNSLILSLLKHDRSREPLRTD
jgi:hypothetical protein